MRNEAQYLKSVEENPNSNKEAARIFVRFAKKIESEISLRDIVVNRLDEDEVISYLLLLRSVSLGEKPLDESLLTPEAEQAFEGQVDLFLRRAREVLAK